MKPQFSPILDIYLLFMLYKPASMGEHGKNKAKSSHSQEIIEGVRAVLKEMGLDSISGIISEIKKTQDDFQQALKIINDDYHDIKENVNKLQKENSELLLRLEFSENRIAGLEKSVKDCQMKIISQQARSMTDNLIIHGIKESKNENTRKVVIKFLKNEMKIGNKYFQVPSLDGEKSVEAVWIHRCHRLGHQGNDKRPIIINLVEGKDVIFRHTHNLKGKDFFISSQLPPEIAENKQKLSGLFKQAKSEKKNPKYVGKGDSLLVDGKVYNAPQVPLCTTAPQVILAHRHAMNMCSSEARIEKENKFMAYIADVSAQADIPPTLSALKNSVHDIALATHNMFAVRVSVGSSIQEYHDDDGEHSGSRHIMQELRKHNVVNKIVMVSRWYSGNQLGKKRFHLIAQCTNDVLTASGVNVQPDPNSQSIDQD